MSKKSTTLTVLAAALVAGLSFSAHAGTVKVAVSPVPHAEIMEFVKPALAKEGVDLKIIEFNDYVQPNLAVSDGELDANYFQHQPYLEAFIKDRGSDLVSLGPVHIEPMGVYSSKIKDLKDVKKGAKVGIPNDPTNGGRALLLLHSAGLIKVENPADVNTSVLDIVENPKNLDIKELEAAQLPRALDDLDFAVINTNYAMPAGLNPLEDALYIESAESPYANILVGNSKSAKSEDLKKVYEALTSKEAADFIKKQYNGAVVPVSGK